MPAKIPGRISTQVRIDETAYKKLKVIAIRENRNANSQLEYFVKKCVAEYEALNGQIILQQEHPCQENPRKE